MRSTCAKLNEMSSPPDAARFEALYREMVPIVHRFAANRLGKADAEDVTSEVFHAAAVAFTDGRAERVTPAWLMAVSRNKVIDRWRIAERRSAISLLNRGRHDDYVEFPADWTADPRRENVLAALDQCKPRERTLLVLHYLDGMPASQLAETMDCSISAMESRLARARRSFRKFYAPEVPRD